uniref:Zgc:103625 n=1 Tax=Callorhinchus milii TaxID=7868 RepID=A0A4W3KK38_CALMI
MMLSPMAEKNKQAILEVLMDYMETVGESFALELASGSGQHIVHFARAFPNVTWQPSDISQSAQESVAAYVAATKVTNVKEVVYIDVAEPWEEWANLQPKSCDLIVNINMLHFTPISKWRGAAQASLHHSHIFLCLRQPYAINGIISNETNAQLDRQLRQRNPDWGLPDMDVLRQLAYEKSLRLERMVEMLEDKCLIFRKFDEQ